MSDVSVHDISALYSYISRADTLVSSVQQIALVISQRIQFTRDNARATVATIEAEIEEIDEEKMGIDECINDLRSQLQDLDAESDPDGSERAYLQQELSDERVELAEVRERLRLRQDDLRQARVLQNRVEAIWIDVGNHLTNLQGMLPAMVNRSTEFIRKYISYLQQAQSQR